MFVCLPVVVQTVTEVFNALSLDAHVVLECVPQILREVVGFLEGCVARGILAATKSGNTLSEGLSAPESGIEW